MTRRWRRAALVVTLAGAGLAVACIYTGGDPRRDNRMTYPIGVRATFRLAAGDSVRGELLSVDSLPTFVLLVEDGARKRLVVVPLGHAASVRLPGMVGAWRLPLSPKQLAELRTRSRFPFGITDSARASLLRGTGQARFDTVGASASLDASARLDEFLNAARAGTERYQSIELAAADGFKRVGTEFPFMGEHWVNLARVLENRFAAAAPSVLTYVTVAGERVLAGVGYGALLRPGEAVPAGVAPASAWHEHSGAVVDESLPLHGPSGAHDRDASDAPDSLRFMVLHAWVWTPNPRGVFVTDNPTLPLVRLGATPALDAGALRGLTLAQDSAGYYAQMLRTSLRASEVESGVLDRVVADGRALARRGVGGRTVDAAVLRDAWVGLWRELDRALPARASDLARLRGALEH